jgi:hypothetical protein
MKMIAGVYTYSPQRQARPGGNAIIGLKTHLSKRTFPE